MPVPSRAADPPASGLRTVPCRGGSVCRGISVLANCGLRGIEGVMNASLRARPGGNKRSAEWRSRGCRGARAHARAVGASEL
jgi:hypothetical protein